ncbi:MAG TPA: hypothetical protein VFO25_13300 [Candidatus Eremiobacteraceae bacterium]|nr:hypothetical protein [Candidatus Eremiobacteraceae bacterium]
MGEGVGDLRGLALGRGDGFALPVGMTVKVGIGDSGAAGIW